MGNGMYGNRTEPGGIYDMKRKEDMKGKGREGKKGVSNGGSRLPPTLTSPGPGT